MSKRILLVGATGYAGCELAGCLLEHTSADLILAGRSRSKLAELETALQNFAARIELLELDASHFDSAALCDFDVLANATADGPHNASLIDACLDRGADWIDMQMTNELLDPSPALKERIESGNSCFVIQAGFHPGMIAPLVRYADLQMDTMRTAMVSSVIRDEDGMPFTSGFMELIDSFREYSGETYRDGTWQKMGYSDYPKIGFEYGFGELVTYPLDMPELRQLPVSMPDLKDTGFFVAGFNWFADYFVTPLIMLTSRIAPEQTAAPLGRLLSWSTRTFPKPPYGTVLQVDAEGERDGHPASFRLSLFHDDTYALTAIPTMAMIKQMLDGHAQPGIHLMGLFCDPDQLVRDIGRTDISIQEHVSG